MDMDWMSALQPPKTIVGYQVEGFRAHVEEYSVRYKSFLAQCYPQLAYSFQLLSAMVLSFPGAYIDLSPSPDNRLPINFDVIVSEIVPLLLCYYASAVLITVPNTIAIRLALLPITVWLAWRVGTGFYFDDPQFNHLNYGLGISILVIVMRAIEWTFRINPYRRVHKSDAQIELRSPREVLLEGFDLACNARGIGWCWGRNCIPSPLTPITSSFTVDTFLRMIGYLSIFDVIHTTLQFTGGLTSPVGASIYDPSLPPIPRYLRSTFLTFLTGLSVYTAVNTLYQFFTLIGVIIFRQNQSQWPPLFNSPIHATSLADYWGKRWHQLFRRNFLIIGGKPMHFLFGKIGGAFGVFLVSALLHDLGMWCMGRGMEFETVGVYFLIQGLGMVIEAAIEAQSGIKFSGRWGKLWVYAWVVPSANILSDAWHRRGLAGSTFIPDPIRPTHLAWLALSSVYQYINKL
ncbi:hypothetical protein SISNIDRAFT_429221 [Sistotremastrum niveocremeum HHB9708]|uniref:Wax synthase domain-containing protein n=2 Tax=Sistotremastraceae TaxID=3402574 RepID=A0A164TPT4_9AGAM|nr:hypothetical protein SISNIDRAFT_429221 [Sistotremastrum niveocremeum HHB9708]KZT42209.1 hypothetical protein SISSUDRAFT_999616 [Sistotremastrum suecicum HHB10207 ss-3]